MHNFDTKYTHKILNLPPTYGALLSSMSFFGEPWVILTIAAAGFISAVARGQDDVKRAFIYCVIAYGLNIGLKLALHRRRPHGKIITNFGVQSYSFPSGHAFGTVIFYGLFAYLDLKFLAIPFNIILAGLILIAVFLTGVSRVYLRTHYPSDVLAGWLTGAISLTAVVLLAF
jgi:membrane-associated phospholipid phosphatase